MYGVLLVTIVILTYANNLSGPFFFDDLEYIVANPHIRSFDPSVVLTGPLIARPVVNLSLAVNYAFGGLDVTGYHAFNILLHAVNTLLLFGLVRGALRTNSAASHRDPRTSGVAAIIAALWAVHPLQTESVNYLTQRSELFAGFFYLMTMYASARGSGRRLDGWQALAVITCFLGMATKQWMVTAPVLVLLYDMCVASRSPRDALSARPSLYAGLAASLTIVPALLFLGLQPAAVGWWHGVSPYDYALNQSRMITRYLRLVVWPFPLVIDYGEPTPLTVADVWPDLAMVGALVVAAAILLFRRPRAGFLGAWFFVILAPSSSIVPIISEVGAERRMYLPLAAVVTFLVLLVASRVKPLIGAVFAVAVGALLVARTMERNAEYADPAVLWRSATREIPTNPRAHNSLGATLGMRGEVEEAIAEFNEALRLRPGYVNARENLALATRTLETRNRVAR